MSNPLSPPPVANALEWLGQSIHFQRAELADQLLNSVLADQLVVLMGPQGNGKSTLATESLIWRFEEGGITGLTGGSDWRIVKTRPYADPLGNLTAALSEPGVLFAAGEKDLSFREEVAETLRQDSYGLVNLYQSVNHQVEKPFNLLLIVKQHQDFFRYQEHIPGGDDELFLKLMLTAAQEEVPIYVVFVTDDENLSHFSRYRGMPEVINNFRFEVPHLPAEDICTQLLEIHGEDKLPVFLKQAVEAYADLLAKKDQFALLKFTHFLRYTYHAWKDRKIVPGEDITLGDFFQKRMERGIFYSLGEQLTDLYKRLGKDTPQEKRLQQIAAFMFAAMSERGMANQALSRPVALAELQKIVSRVEDQEVSRSELFQVIDHFNGATRGAYYPHHFINITSSAGQSLSTTNLVDLTSNAIPGTWFLLRKWTDEESMRGSIYLATVAAARTYISQRAKDQRNEAVVTAKKESKGSFRLWWERLWSKLKKIRQKPEKQDAAIAEKTADDLLYVGATLVGAVDWLETGYPTEAWSERYPLPPQRALTTNEAELIKRLLKETGEKEITNLKLARWFVYESKKKDDERREQEKADNLLRINQANKQSRRALILAAIAVISFLVGMFYLNKAHIAQAKLEQINLVDILNLNNILEEGPGEGATEIERLDVTIANNKKINSRRKVLEYLAQEKYLLINEEESKAELSYRALLTIDQLYDELQKGQPLKKGTDFENGTDLSSSTWELWQVCNDAQAAGPSQYPYLYYALATQLKVLRKEAGFYNAEDRSLIEDLASNPQDKVQYAYGDRNGLVIIAERTEDNQLKEIYSETIDGKVSATEYSKDGQQLFVGVREGKIYRFNNVSTKGAITYEQLLDLNKKDVSQIIPFQENNLIVRSGNVIYLIDAKNGTIISQQEISDIKSVSHISLSENGEESLLMISGRDASFLYDIQLRNRNNFLQERFKIFHEGITIFRTALKTYASRPNKSWLFLGSETGGVWYTEDYLQMFEDGRSVNLRESAIFTSLRPHSSSITSLVFNEKRPQLATCSLDGSMQFWNLDKLDDPSEQIKMKNRGQGIWDMCYINDSQVIIAENINTQVWHTSIESQRRELKRLLCQDQFCNDELE